MKSRPSAISSRLLIGFCFSRPTDRLGVPPRSVSVSPLAAQISTATKTSSDLSIEDPSFDPFARGILSLESAQSFLDYFTGTMIPYFPFVLLPKLTPVEDVFKDRPCACLAALAAASHSETQTQKALSGLFNQLAASRLVDGKFRDMDLLQGLLIHLAW